jgi:hypothetical protein
MPPTRCCPALARAASMRAQPTPPATTAPRAHTFQPRFPPTSVFGNSYFLHSLFLSCSVAYLTAMSVALPVTPGMGGTARWLSTERHEASGLQRHIPSLHSVPYSDPLLPKAGHAFARLLLRVLPALLALLPPLPSNSPPISITDVPHSGPRRCSHQSTNLVELHGMVAAGSLWLRSPLESGPRIMICTLPPRGRGTHLCKHTQP